MKRALSIVMLVVMFAVLVTACAPKPEPAAAPAPEATPAAAEQPAAEKKLKIAFAYQDLETEFWVAGHKAIVETLKAKGIEVIEFNANEDANKQLEQVNDAIAQKVDGIIIIPQDGESAVAIGEACNSAGIPFGVFNRPPSNKDAKALVAVADNVTISAKAMEHMALEARKVFEKTGKKVKPLVMVGDLGDPNAVGRYQGFKNVYEKNKDIFTEYIEVPTKWDSNTALANLKSAMAANKDVGLLFCGSDFLYPVIKSVLEPLGKWQKIGDPNHIIMGAVDGDMTAGKLMDEGYVDATAVQDLYYEAELILTGMLEAIEKGEKTPEKWMDDPGFALTQANMGEMKMRMWGNKLRQEKGEL